MKIIDILQNLKNYAIVSKKDFPAFFAQFVKDAEEVTKKKYKMRFANIIHRTVSVLILIKNKKTYIKLLCSGWRHYI